MTIKFDSAHVKFGLNQVSNGRNKIDSKDNNTIKIEKSMSFPKQSEQKTIHSNNANSFVRGTSKRDIDIGVLNVLSVSTISLIAISTLNKEYLENLLPGKEKYGYIFIDSAKRMCKINVQNILDFEVIVQTKKKEILNLGKLTEFSVEELNEVIFVEIRNNVKKILEIKTEDCGIWERNNNSKYYDVF